MYEQVKIRLLKLHTACSKAQLALWLSKESELFGRITTKREKGRPNKGRALWLFNEAVKGKEKAYV